MPEVNAAPSRPKRSEVRARILDAAASTFARCGFAGASIDAIADAAGFTKGAVYSNFGSKDDLF
ncbi:TetR family transcriptional regulator, partial [Mycobacterium sp. THU-M116]